MPNIVTIPLALMFVTVGIAAQCRGDAYVVRAAASLATIIIGWKYV